MNKQINAVTPQSLKKMMLYSRPGNIRELENIIECAIVIAREDVISENMMVVANQKDESTFRSFKESKHYFESSYFLELMKISKSNISHAAKIAGKYRADLYALLEKHKLNSLDFRKD
jgi:two-component system response regulator GlrR